MSYNFLNEPNAKNIETSKVNLSISMNEYFINGILYIIKIHCKCTEYTGYSRISICSFVTICVQILQKTNIRLWWMPEAISSWSLQFRVKLGGGGGRDICSRVSRYKGAKMTLTKLHYNKWTLKCYVNIYKYLKHK